jgi:hypothetical protein
MTDAVGQQVAMTDADASPAVGFWFSRRRQLVAGIPASLALASECGPPVSRPGRHRLRRLLSPLLSHIDFHAGRADLGGRI